MYFENRAQAGYALATQLFAMYHTESCAVLALNDGGVLVGEQIAGTLNCVLMMLVTKDVDIPGEDLSLGSVSQTGNFTYNSELTDGEVKGYVSEFHGYLEDEKRKAFQGINRLMGVNGVLDRDLLRDKNIVLVSDGFDESAAVDVALDFLKPIRYRRLIAAGPIATVNAVDRLHVAADELHILDVKENYMGVDHYYTDNTIPSHEDTVQKINANLANWQ